MKITSNNGKVQCIYSDAIAPILHDLGKPDIKRVSHVEPTEDGAWTADMRPIGGPVLGPFQFRQAALDAEVKWLRDTWGL